MNTQKNTQNTQIITAEVSVKELPGLKVLGTLKVVSKTKPAVKPVTKEVQKVEFFSLDRAKEYFAKGDWAAMKAGLDTLNWRRSRDMEVATEVADFLMEGESNEVGIFMARLYIMPWSQALEILKCFPREHVKGFSGRVVDKIDNIFYILEDGSAETLFECGGKMNRKFVLFMLNRLYEKDEKKILSALEGVATTHGKKFPMVNIILKDFYESRIELV